MPGKDSGRPRIDDDRPIIMLIDRYQHGRPDGGPFDTYTHVCTSPSQHYHLPTSLPGAPLSTLAAHTTAHQPRPDSRSGCDHTPRCRLPGQQADLAGHLRQKVAHLVSVGRSMLQHNAFRCADHRVDGPSGGPPSVTPVPNSRARSSNRAATSRRGQRLSDIAHRLVRPILFRIVQLLRVA